MVTVTLPRLDLLRFVPLNPHKLRIAAALFALAAVAALLTGCSADSGTDDATNGLSALRGIALATRPAINITSDPAQPQRHARQPHFNALHLSSTLQRRQIGSTF